MEAGKIMKMVSVRLTADEHSKVIQYAAAKNITVSDAIREFIKAGIEEARITRADSEALQKVETWIDKMDPDKLYNYMHDLLRIALKNDMVLHNTVVRQNCKTQEELTKFYEPILTELEKRGFSKPLIGRKEE